MKHWLYLIFLSIFTLLLSGCVSAEATAMLPSTETVPKSQTLIQVTLPPTQLPSTSTRPVFTPTILPAKRPTRTRPPIVTELAERGVERLGSPTAVRTKTPTLTPTATKALLLPSGDKLFKDLSRQGYEVADWAVISSTHKTEVYLYILKDPSVILDEDSPDRHQLLFYEFRDKFRLLAALEAPQTPPAGTWEGKGSYTAYPVYCTIGNWDDFRSFHLGLFNFLLEEDPTYLAYPDMLREQLAAAQYRSDINHNGLPEFVVSGFYCSNACSVEEAAIHFYEIRENGVVDLTANLPGVVVPWEIIYPGETPTIYVRDITLQFDLRSYVYSFWLYEWDGNQFVDASSKHADEYRRLAEPLIADIKTGFGKPFVAEYDLVYGLLEVFFYYQKAGLRDEALTVFLDLTDPVHWPGTTPDILCWLQLIRATAQQEYKEGVAFSLPPNIDLSRFVYFSVSRFLEKQPEYRQYDLSACPVAFP